MTTPRPVREAENRLERFNADRERILAEVQRRVLESYHEAAAASGEASLEYVLNDVAYSEIRRIEASSNPDGKSLARWRDLAARLVRMDDRQKRDELAALVRHYCRDVVGNFNPRVYRFASEVLPAGLNFIFSPVRGLRDLAPLDELHKRVQVEGAVDHVRAVCERGTLVVTPTHSSNMDSVVIGHALMAARLPPVTYGAGKNLFTNPFISFFMRNLGAYRVDRRLRFELYKDVLKEYSTVLLENGYHSLFFPGGTRSRSNMVEQHLKLGLLGTTVTAYRNNLRRGEPYKRLFIVPVTINYRLVLEAETLIDDYLAETGKSRYIITDDEFSRLGRIVEFVRKMLVHEGALIIRLGKPLDPFGNDVDEEGNSYDRRGRRVDPSSYLRDADGAITDDAQRDTEYTKHLGRRLTEVFRQETVLHATHLLSRALFDAVTAAAGTRDMMRLLRVPTQHLSVPIERARLAVGELRDRIAAEPALGQLHPAIRDASVDQIIDDAVSGLGTYHARAVVARRTDELVVGDVKLLYYYQNRTAHIAARSASARPGARSGAAP
jgi:glycerol-3-phosphate O-acyltransferase